MQRITYTLAEFVGGGHGLTQERTSPCVYGTGHKGTGRSGRWDNHAARSTAVRSSFRRPARERSQISTATVLIEKPIQNAIPKNWLGARCVSGLVAKRCPLSVVWLRSREGCRSRASSTPVSDFVPPA